MLLLIFFLSKEGLTKREKLTSDYQECFTGQMYLNFKDLNILNTNVFKIQSLAQPASIH